MNDRYKMASPMLKEQDVDLSIVSTPTLPKSPVSLSASVFSDLDNIKEVDICRKRPREGEYDVQSLSDFSRGEHSGPSKKRVKKRHLSILSLVSLVKDSPKGAKSALTRSFSFTKDSQVSAKYVGTRTPHHPSAKKSKTLRPHIPLNWIDVIEKENRKFFAESDVKRQEAIYSLLRTEMEMVEDLKMVLNVFYHPMLSLNLLSAEEHCKIFGCIHLLLPLHEDLVHQLHDLKKDEVIENVGDLLLQWFSTLTPYVEYCSNLVIAKRVLEEKKNDPRVLDFLQRCLESEFSRKIDLWTFLDSPRSRLMKYPILLREIKRLTSKDHPDWELLLQALVSVESLIKKVDSCTGLTKCRDTISRLEFIFDHQRLQSIEESLYIVCSGVLKSKNGSKLQAFLFDKAFILTRMSTRSAPSTSYQVYRNPIPVEYLVVEAVDDGEIKLSGSFRGTLPTANAASKHFIRVSSSNPGITRHCYILQASSEYDKRVWMDAFSSVMFPKERPAPSDLKKESIV